MMHASANALFLLVAVLSIVSIVLTLKDQHR